MGLDLNKLRQRNDVVSVEESSTSITIFVSKKEDEANFDIPLLESKSGKRIIFSYPLNE